MRHERFLNFVCFWQAEGVLFRMKKVLIGRYDTLRSIAHWVCAPSTSAATKYLCIHPSVSRKYVVCVRYIFVWVWNASQGIFISFNWHMSCRWRQRYSQNKLKQKREKPKNDIWLCCGDGIICVASMDASENSHKIEFIRRLSTAMIFS